MGLIDFRQFFASLEQDEQKDKLLLLLLLPIFVFAETAILLNLGFFSDANLLFITGYVTMSLIAVVCRHHPLLCRWFKQVFLTVFLLFTFFELWLFNFFPQAPEMIFVVLTLSLIYLNVRLTLYIGLSSIFFCLVSFFFWKEQFFPYVESFSAFLPILVLLLETTLVLAGVTLLGGRFNHYVHSADRQRKVMQQLKEQSTLIQQQNAALQEYAKQVEWLTVQEERNRLLHELQTSIGGSLSSLLPEAESLQHEHAPELYQHKPDQLAHVSTNYIRFIKDKLEEWSGTVPAPFPYALRAMIEEYQVTHDVSISLMVLGEEYDVSPSVNVSILRCLQDLFSLSFADERFCRAEVVLSYQPERLMIVFETECSADAVQADRIDAAIRRRVANLHGDYQVTSCGVGLTRRTLHVPSHRSVQPIKLVLAIKHDMLAESMNMLLETEADLTVLTRIASGRDAVAAPVESEPDIILWDLHHPEELSSIEHLKKRWPTSKIIAFSSQHEQDVAVQSIRLDIHSFLDQSILLSGLAPIIRIVHRGSTFLTLETGRKIADHFSTLLAVDSAVSQADSLSFGLTDKEIAILQYLSEGYKYKEIAEKLHFSESTIKNYISIIYSKLEVENRMKAVKKAKEFGAIA